MENNKEATTVVMPYKIKELKGISGYQFMQVIYFILRSGYYTPEINKDHPKIEDYFKWVASLEGEELDTLLTELLLLGGDLSPDYINIILKNTEKNGQPIIPESIQTIPVEDLLYIVREGLKKVLSISLPF